MQAGRHTADATSVQRTGGPTQISRRVKVAGTAPTLTSLTQNLAAVHMSGTCQECTVADMYLKTS